MRWLSFTRGDTLSFGYVTTSGDGVVDVGARTAYRSMREAIEADALQDLARECGDEADLPLDGLVYAPPIPDPKKILCVGLNYKAHQEETGRGGEGVPTIFARFAAAQVAHQQPMIEPRESSTLDWEGEIAMIIGKAGRRISQADALDHVVGFSIYNDGSVREYQRHTSQFTPGKNFAATGGFGPWIMTTDEVGDVQKMALTTRVNGEVMQSATSDLMVHGFTELIEFCSTFIELEPGDVIVTGTPGGVGSARNPPIFLHDGDEVEIEVTPIGKLFNPVVAET